MVAAGRLPAMKKPKGAKAKPKSKGRGKGKTTAGPKPRATPKPKAERKRKAAPKPGDESKPRTSPLKKPAARSQPRKRPAAKSTDDVQELCALGMPVDAVDAVESDEEAATAYFEADGEQDQHDEADQPEELDQTDLPHDGLPDDHSDQDLSAHGDRGCPDDSHGAAEAPAMTHDYYVMPYKSRPAAAVADKVTGRKSVVYAGVSDFR